MRGKGKGRGIAAHDNNDDLVVSDNVEKLIAALKDGEVLPLLAERLGLSETRRCLAGL